VTNDARPLDKTLDLAVSGDVRPLYEFLCRVSGLPGVRLNTGIVTAFALACESRGKIADPLVRRMASLHPDEAPGGTALEFLPVCAVAALGLRAASEPRMRAKLLPMLHDLAEDMRFRVRDVVPEALATIGAKIGPVLLDEIAPWMDGYFHAAAVLRALARSEWHDKLPDGAPVVECFRASFRLLDESPRAARRYPGYKALADAVMATPKALGSRYGAPLLACLSELAITTDPDLAALIAKSIDDPKLRARHADAIAAIEAALAGAKKPPRDPSRIVHGTRRRGRR
jgi:hypothetical protein